MDKETQVLKMAKILCPKGTANCEKCSKNYKCDVKFSQLAELFDGGCQIVGEDEIVIKKSDYEELSKDYATINNEAYYCGLSVGREETEQETTREILTTIYNRLRCATFQQTVALKIVKDIANELGIELE